MSDIKENVINSIKTLILPELSKLQEGINEIRIRQESLEKQMVVINENILGNSRRIDELNKRIDGINQRIDETNQRIDDTNKSVHGTNQRIDETNQRIDETNKRIDLIYVEIGNIKKEMERMKREDAVTADILHRMEVLEEKVLLKQ
ncbi:MAG: coiled-coil domain-containing protein [Candidatus Scalindua sp.]